jgi:hypothetical protein
MPLDKWSTTKGRFCWSRESPENSRVGIVGYRDRIFMYCKKSGKSIRAAARDTRISTANTTIPKMAIAYICRPSTLTIRLLKDERCPFRNSFSGAFAVDFKCQHNARANQVAG